MSNYQSDIETEAFILSYGIVNLLEDLDVKNIKRSNADNVIANCPFHEDKSPSFSINTSNGFFKCFGCSEQGNLNQFIQKSYNLDYKNAKQFIMARSGLSSDVNLKDIILIREVENGLKNIQNSKQSFKIEKLNDKIIERMYESPDPHNYLQNRGFSKDSIDYFECGYTKHYLGIGYKEQERITIPGHDEYGNICGFIGRTPVDEMPKYLYTAGYPKSHTLFNLHRAKKYSDKGLIIVEGSLDVMRIHDLGYPNVCAILGASLSDSQLKLLQKYTDKVYLMFDSDNAGKIATQKAMESLQGKLDINKVSLKNFKDPGEIDSKKTLENLLSNSKNWFIYNIQSQIKRNHGKSRRK